MTTTKHPLSATRAALLDFAGRCRGAARHLRYRRGDLARLAAVEMSGGDAAAASRFHWVDAATMAGRAAVLDGPPTARVVYDVVLPANACVTVEVGSTATTAADPPGQVESTLEVIAGGTTTVAQAVTTSSRAGQGVQWRRLRLAVPSAGDARIVLRARVQRDAAGLRALWAAPRIEAPRSAAHLRDALRSATAPWSLRTLVQRVRWSNTEQRYADWARRNLRSSRALRAERTWATAQPRQLFSLVTWVPDPGSWHPGRTLTSLRSQTYADWEWLIASPAGTEQLAREALGAAGRDARVTTVATSPGTTEAAAWNEAVGAARGTFVAVLGADDALAPSALYEAARSLERWPDATVLYSDHDTLNAVGERCDPHFKPDWSPELLLATFYIGRLALLRTEAVHRAGGFEPGCGNAAEWDLVLRVADGASSIHRIASCLYHRDQRAPGDDGDGAVAIRRHFERRGLTASLRRMGDVWRAEWPPPRRPLVSIVIPNRNAAAMLGRCVQGIRATTTYDHHEIVIVDNGSTDPDVLALYRTLEDSGQVRLVAFDRPFNFSAACNAGAAAARGELLLFLNNDIEIIDPGWLEELVRWALRPEIGIVGAKLLYPDRTIQHAGVVFGLGLVGHIFARAAEHETGLFGSPATYRNYLAVTGACQMMRRDVFDQLGGFDERLRVSFSDVVLCLEAWKAGYRVIYTPYARLVHHESQTRQRDDSPHDKLVLANYLATSGRTDDPFCHPELNPRSLVPSLRPPFEPRPQQVVATQIANTLAAADMGGR